jgi:putative two-component system response regulator
LAAWMAEPARILIVDDEAFVREVLVRKLRALGYHCATCEDGRAALHMLKASPSDLLLTSIGVPGPGGVDFIREAQSACPGLAIILVTSVVDLSAAVEALKHGASDYITKPFTLEEVAIAVARALEKRRLVLENEQYRRTLEEQVATRTLQLKEALEVLQATYRSTLMALGTALDSRDANTGHHSLRVTLYTVRLAAQLGVSKAEIRTIEQGALVHDIGKIGVPDELLRKPGPLSEEEWELMRRHPEIGYRVLCGGKFLQESALMVLHHHERFDGTGYPGGLSGENIVLGARIFSVADALDCMTSDRPFQAATTFQAAQNEIVRCSGTQFDPKMVEAFMRIRLQEWEEIRQSVAARLIPPR